MATVSVSFSITIVSPNATAVTGTPPSPLPAGWVVAADGGITIPAPLTAGTVVTTLAVTPPNWQGGFTLTQTGGPQANAFVMNGNNIQVGAADLTQMGAYALSVAPTP